MARAADMPHVRQGGVSNLGGKGQGLGLDVLQRRGPDLREGKGRLQATVFLTPCGNGLRPRLLGGSL